jgi:Flp pilus assembly pilin Flp
MATTDSGKSPAASQPPQGSATLQREDMSMKFLKSILSDERGLETVEYAIMGGLVIVAIIAAIVLLRTAIANKFNQITTAIG